MQLPSTPLNSAISNDLFSVNIAWKKYTVFSGKYFPAFHNNSFNLLHPSLPSLPTFCPFRCPHTEKNHRHMRTPLFPITKSKPHLSSRFPHLFSCQNCHLPSMLWISFPPVSYIANCVFSSNSSDLPPC